MVPVSVSSSSVGAPQLDGDPGSLFHVLRFALPQLGWTEEFVDINRFRAGFRNDPAAGTGHYLEIVDDPDEHGEDPAVVQMLGYQSMTDVGVGIGQFPNNAWIQKSFTGDSDLKPWRVIGDSRSFWLMFNPYTSNTRPCFWYFGDGNPFAPTDQALFLVTGAGSPSLGATGFNSMFNNYGGLQTIAAAQDFALTQVGQPLTILHTAQDGAHFHVSTGLLSGQDGDPFPNNISGGLSNAPIILIENDRYRGMLRGAFGILVDVETTVSQGFIPQGYPMSEVQTFLGPRDLELIKLTSRPHLGVFESNSRQVIAFDTAGDWDDWN